MEVITLLAPAVERTVEELVAIVREKNPELLGPLPAGLPEVDAARAEAVRRVGA